jgi:hypothetical protein
MGKANRMTDQPMPPAQITSVATRLCAEWWLCRGSGDVPYPGDRYFWYLAEQEIGRGNV